MELTKKQTVGHDCNSIRSYNVNFFKKSTNSHATGVKFEVNYRVGQKNWDHRLMTIILSNLNRF